MKRKVQMSNILITGDEGFIGSRLSQVLQKKGHTKAL